MQRPFIPTDFARLEVREEDSHLDVGLLLNLAKSSATFTVEVEGEILTIGGITDLKDRVASIWQVPSKHTKDHIFSFCRAARSLVNIAKAMGYKTLVTDIKKDDLHLRWAKHIGLHGTGALGPLEGTEVFMRRID